MLKVKVWRLDKTGNMKSYTMKLKDTRENNLNLEKMAESAEDCYVDQSENWR
jgi:hypothetical protein